jgi:predicted small lipoprotein YifL
MVEESGLVGTSGFSRIALIGMLAGALALGACGRKGPLEAPPSANSVAAAPQDQPPSLGQTAQPGFEDQRSQGQEQPLAPSKKTFVLDGIL